MTQRTLDSNLDTGSTSAVFAYIVFVELDFPSGTLYVQTSAVFAYIVFVELDFPSGTLYVHNGHGTYTWGGNDWLGVGAYGSIDVMEESIDTIPNPVKVMLSSITSEIIEAIRNDDIYDRDAKIYLGAINEDLELQGTPTTWVDGYMEKKELVMGSQDGVAITVQDDAAKLRQRNGKRFTIEEHQAEFTGDLFFEFLPFVMMFFEFLPFVMNAEVLWAGEKVRTGFQNTEGLTGGGSGGGTSERDRNRRDTR
jgi:hypothetical protein